MLESKDKKEIKAKILKILNEQKEILYNAVQTATDATTHGEAKQEGKYDTRAIEASYLAGAQAERLADLDQKISTIERLKLADHNCNDRVQLTSLISVQDPDQGLKWYLLLPGAAGVTVQVKGIDITILSIESNLGNELIGKELGEEIELIFGGKTKYLTIEKIM